MSKFPIPRGTARAIRRGNTAPSVNFFVPSAEPDLAEDEFIASDNDSLQRYRDLREEGYSYHQAMLMSGRGDPDSLGCS
jgi:hypothetical protein